METLKTKKIDIKGIFELVFVILSTLFSVASIAISSTIIFHNNYYEFFWVNGQSMYPTLNKNAKKSDGRLIGIRDVDAEGNYDVDYGYMDKHESVINNIKRFDIIVCHQIGSEKDIIKRVIALPGEEFYIVSSNNKEADGDNGNLYVKNKDTNEFEYVAQDFISVELLRAGNYMITGGNEKYNTGYELDKDEYFVMGDNRLPDCSSDSRGYPKGILKSNIKGVAIGLEGTCSVIRGSDNKLKSAYIKRYWPTRF